MLNCAPFAPACLRASPIINIRLTRLYPYQLVPCTFLSCLALCCVLCFVFELQLTIHPHLCLLSFTLPYRAVLHAFFHSYFKPWVTLLVIQLFCNNIFWFSHLLFFWNKLNKQILTDIVIIVTVQTLKLLLKIYNA